MKIRAWLAMMGLWAVAGTLVAGESGAFAVTVVSPQSKRYVEPTEGVFVISREPVVFHVRVMNTAGETKSVQADLAGACALELTDSSGNTTLVTRKQAGGEAGASAAEQPLVNGNDVLVSIPFDPSGWDNVPALTRGVERQFDLRAVYRSVMGKRTFSKSYTVIFRL